MALTFQATGLKVKEEGGVLIYDEAALLLLKITPLSIYVHNILQPFLGPKEIRLSEGPPVVAACASLDGRMMALQRSPGNLQFMDLASGKTFVQGPWKGKASLMGFFWSSASECSFAMVTKSGVETYQVQANKQCLELVHQYSHSVKWWKYSHRAKILVLGTGDLGIWLQAYQFTMDGILRLPPFQVTVSSASGSAVPQGTLEADCVSIMTMYSRVYCTVMDRKERRLSLYRFYKDAVLLQHRVDVASGSTKMSIVDDLLLVHNLRTCQSMVVDVAAEYPIAEGLSVSFDADFLEGKDVVDARVRFSKLQFHLPNIIIDPLAQEVLKSRVDVAAVAQNSCDRPKMVGFVLRRNPELHRIDLSKLALGVMKEALVEKASLETVRLMFDGVTSHQAASFKRKAETAKVVISPQEICKEVFSWLHTEEAVDAHYLQAAIVEYQASAASFGVELPLMQQILAFEVALQLGHEAQVAAEVAWGHDKDCRQLASELEACAQLPYSFQLANDMRCRVDDREQVCRSLLLNNQILQGVKLAQKHGLQHLVTPEVLEKTAQQGIWTFAAVYRAFQQQFSQDYPDLESALEHFHLRNPASA